MRDSGPADPPLYSIGHSNHTWETFLGLLHLHQIQVLADVRSAPYSKYSPHFDLKTLEGATRDAGLEYVYLGRELGGRPIEDDCYDAEGKVLYDRRARAAEFLEGIARLERGRTRYRVAMMCSEEDPWDCHRLRLIARECAKRGIPTRHIRARTDVAEQSNEDVAYEHSPLLAFTGEDIWTFIPSVSPSAVRQISSEP